MKNKMTKTAMLSALALTGAFATQSASAALIESWNYTVNSTFSNFTETGTGGTGVTGSNPNAVLGGDTRLEWNGSNDDGAPSSVEITSQVQNPPTLFTNGDSVDGAVFTHNNNVLTNPVTNLDTFMVQTQLDLEALTPPTGDTQQFGPVTFNSFFTETNNEAPCTEGSVSVCDDIFVLTNAGPNTQDPNLLTQESFTIDDFVYTVSLELAGLGFLADDECTAAGADTGCIGFTTVEDQSNTFQSSFNITATQLTDVPEPGSLALLGGALSLIGFGAARRSNRKA